MTSAVITFVMLAAGKVWAFPELARRPRPETPTAAEPRDGQGRPGAVPGTTSDVRKRWAGETAGMGRRELKAPRARRTSSSATSRRTRIAQELDDRQASQATEVDDGM